MAEQNRQFKAKGRTLERRSGSEPITWPSEPVSSQCDSSRNTRDSILHSAMGSCVQERNAEVWGLWGSYLHILKHMHNEIPWWSS